MRRIKISLPRFNVPTADDRSPDANTRVYIYIIIIYVQYTSVHNTRRVFLPTRFFPFFMEELNGRFTETEGGSGGGAEKPLGGIERRTHILFYIIRHKYACMYIYIIMYNMNESENIH